MTFEIIDIIYHSKDITSQNPAVSCCVCQRSEVENVSTLTYSMCVRGTRSEKHGCSLSTIRIQMYCHNYTRKWPSLTEKTLFFRQTRRKKWTKIIHIEKHLYWLRMHECSDSVAFLAPSQARVIADASQVEDNSVAFLRYPCCNPGPWHLMDSICIPGTVCKPCWIRFWLQQCVNPVESGSD